MSAAYQSVSTLPPNPSLALLGSFAKALRKAHKTQSPEAIARFKSRHPKFASSDVSTVADTEVSLRDAQMVVAREYGFDNWASLKKHILAGENATSIGGISPFFIVGDYAAARNFYRDRLGFEVRFETPNNEPFFGIVGRLSASLMLKEIAQDVPPQPNHTRHEWARWDAYIHTPNPDILYDEFVARGVSFHEDLADTDDGLRGFGALDADRYVLFFGRPR